MVVAFRKAITRRRITLPTHTSKPKSDQSPLNASRALTSTCTSRLLKRPLKACRPKITCWMTAHTTQPYKSTRIAIVAISALPSKNRKVWPVWLSQKLSSYSRLINHKSHWQYARKSSCHRISLSKSIQRKSHQWWRATTSRSISPSKWTSKAQLRAPPGPKICSQNFNNSIKTPAPKRITTCSRPKSTKPQNPPSICKTSWTAAQSSNSPPSLSRKNLRRDKSCPKPQKNRKLSPNLPYFRQPWQILRTNRGIFRALISDRQPLKARQTTRSSWCRLQGREQPRDGTLCR